MSVYDLSKPAVALYKASGELSELIGSLIDLASPTEAFKAGQIIGRLEIARADVFKVGDFEYMEEFRPSHAGRLYPKPKVPLSSSMLISAEKDESDGPSKVEI